MALKSLHRGTGTWFVNSSIFSEWKACGQSSLLWIHGKRQLPSIAYSFAETDDFSLWKRGLERV